MNEAAPTGVVGASNTKLYSTNQLGAVPLQATEAEQNLRQDSLHKQQQQQQEQLGAHQQQAGGIMSHGTHDHSHAAPATAAVDDDPDQATADASETTALLGSSEAGSYSRPRSRNRSTSPPTAQGLVPGGDQQATH